MPTPVTLLVIVYIAAMLFVVLRFYLREERNQKAEKEVAMTEAASREMKQRKSYERQYIPLPEDQLRFPSVERDGFRLIDLADAATLKPPSDPLPKLKAKRAIEPGTLVRLLMLDEHAEDTHIWIVVLTSEPNDCFTGKIHDADTSWKNEFAKSDVFFHANHIGEIIKSQPQALRH